MAGKKAKVKRLKGKETQPKRENQGKSQITNQAIGHLTGNWLYFCPKELTIRSIYEVLNEQNQVEIWEEAGVLELLLGEKGSFDVETTEIHPKDEVTQAFAKEQEAESVFLVTFAPEDYDVASVVMKQILASFGGIFCGDTEDFMPQIKE